MKMKKYVFLILAALIAAVCYTPLLTGGYGYSEEQALRKKFPSYPREALYEKTIGPHRIVIWNDNGGRSIAVVEKKWGVLSKVVDSNVLWQGYNDEPFHRTWSGRWNGEAYDTLLAVETPEPNSDKIIVTNESLDEEGPDDLDTLRAASDLYLELEVENGFVVYYGALPENMTGGFVFRSVDDQGRILSSTR